MSFAQCVLYSFTFFYLLVTTKNFHGNKPVLNELINLPRNFLQKLLNLKISNLQFLLYQEQKILKMFSLEQLLVQLLQRHQLCSIQHPHQIYSSMSTRITEVNCAS